jgi:hypothetical protein
MSFNFSGHQLPADAVVANSGKVVDTFRVITPLTATSATQPVFIAHEACELVGVREVHGTASTSGTVTAEKVTGTTAVGAGTVMQVGTVSLSATANTVQSGVLAASAATLQLAAGDRVALKIAGTMTNLANCVVELIFKRL